MNATSRRQTLLATGACLLVLLLVALANLRLLPGWLAVCYAFPGGDKLGHVVIYGALMAVLAGGAAPARRHGVPRWWSARATALLLFVSLEELSQAWLPSRTASWLDLACSYTGIALALTWAWHRRQARLLAQENVSIASAR